MLRFDTFYADVRSTVLTGLTTATAGAIAATDTLLGALAKLQASLSSLAPIASPTFTGIVTTPQINVDGYILKGCNPAVAATGTTLATGKVLTEQINIVISATTLSALGVVLPNLNPATGFSAATTVVNTTGVAINVYPFATTARIQSTTATVTTLGAAYSLAAGAAKDFIQVSATQYWTA